MDTKILSIHLFPLVQYLDFRSPVSCKINIMNSLLLGFLYSHDIFVMLYCRKRIVKVMQQCLPLLVFIRSSEANRMVL